MITKRHYDGYGKTVGLEGNTTIDGATVYWTACCLVKDPICSDFEISLDETYSYANRNATTFTPDWEFYARMEVVENWHE